MNLIKKEVIVIQEKIGGINDDQLPRNIISMSADIIGSSTVSPPKMKNTNTMVGFDDVLIEVMDRLTGHPPNRQVLPIVGMGGIGKTTLARNVYDHQYIVNQFDLRVWVTISQEYRNRDILLEALSCLEQSYKKDEYKSEVELGHELYESLCGRRYLIVLDDVWSIEAWEELMLLFPDNNNGSRIMITTRISNVSNYFGSCSFELNFLDEDNSWKLLYKTAFPQNQCCPLELEESGKKIAINCSGLPLTIAVIGGLLAKSEKTLEYWEYIAENLKSTISLEENEHCLKILALSYNHLPIHLKPCFLYMGVYPEDSKIHVSRLMKLWVDEGFLKPIKGKTLEMAAQECFNQLIDRNLILVHKVGYGGKVKYCKIHDLLRDICLREGQKDKFLWAGKVHDLDNLQGIQSQRRISILAGGSTSKEEYYIDRVLETLTSASRTRSLICDLKGVKTFQSFRLLRIFNMANMVSYHRCSIEDICKLVNSRYLAFRAAWKPNFIPSSMHLLWNLQTLIINLSPLAEVKNLMPEIWEMSQLRHLEFGVSISLSDPPNVPSIQGGDDDGFILRNLHTLKKVKNFKLSEEVIKRIPNIKTLRLFYSVTDNEKWWHIYCLSNLGLLDKLESLCIQLRSFFRWCFQIRFPQNFAFPHSLKKLSLKNTRFIWEDMRLIGSLPNLQVLKLKEHSFEGSDWNPVEGDFICLKFLLIESCNDLVRWNANRTHFPLLQHLVLVGLSSSNYCMQQKYSSGELGIS